MNNDFLAHHGILGQKWGVRRYQYQDGSYTPEGRIHYGIGDAKRNIRQLGAKMNRSQYYNTFATKDLNRISLKNTMTRTFGGKVSPEDQKKYDMQKQIASKMHDEYKQDKKAYADAVRAARKEYGDKNIKDIKKSIVGEPIVNTAFENFCTILGTGTAAIGAGAISFGPQTAHNLIPSGIVYGTGLAIKSMPSAMYKSQYKKEKKKLTYEMSGEEQPKKLATIAKEKWSSLDKKQKAAIISGGVAVAGILGAGAIGLSNRNRDPNIIEADWHEVFRELPMG